MTIVTLFNKSDNRKQSIFWHNFLKSDFNILSSDLSDAVTNMPRST